MSIKALSEPITTGASTILAVDECKPNEIAVVEGEKVAVLFRGERLTPRQARALARQLSHAAEYAESVSRK